MLKLNVGLSYPEQSLEEEVEKVKLAEKYGIDYVSVISVDKPRVNQLWEAIKNTWKGSIRLCSAPLYETVLMDEDPKETIKRHASYGVRAMTFHITPKKLLLDAEKDGFVVNSRGGQFIREMEGENPYYENFTELVLYAYECGVREIFLGTSLRPGACEKASPYTMQELKLACDIYDKYSESTNLEFQIEAFGHVPVSEFPIYKYTLGSRQICSMGPLLTDAVNGYDELNAILGYATAVREGFNITTECMLSRKEHIEMPNVADVEDECQKWRVTKLIVGKANGWWAADEEEEKVVSKKTKQRTQCSAHINLFGAMDIQETCNVCGDKCPLLKEKKNA